MHGVIRENPGVVVIHESALLANATELIEMFRESKGDLIVVGSKSFGPGCIMIMYDNKQAAYQATTHLLSAGCRHILFFAPYHADWVQTRLEGVRLAVAHSNVPGVALTERVGKGDVDVVVALVHDEHPHVPTAYQFARKVLNGNAVIDGVVAVNDEDALGFMTAAEELGMKPGVDYRIIGFDDGPESQSMGLSTMHTPCAAMGREAARVAAAAMLGQHEISSVVLKSRLVVRASSMPKS